MRATRSTSSPRATTTPFREQSESDGVRIVRVPVAVRVGKGVVMPAHGRTAGRLIAAHDVVSIHVPQFEAGALALRARLHWTTERDDVSLRPSAAGRRVQSGGRRVVAVSNRMCATLTDSVVAYTDDYAESVPLLRRAREKLEVISPPVVMPAPSREAMAAFRHRNRLVRPDGTPLPTIGMAGRFASEKGIDVLVAAFPGLIAASPTWSWPSRAPMRTSSGRRDYRRRLAGPITSLGERWRLLGPLDPVAEMPAFLGRTGLPRPPQRQLDGVIRARPSRGDAQRHACGCERSSRGARPVVRTTGMGELAAPGDAAGLAEAVGRVLEQPRAYVRPQKRDRARIRACDDGRPLRGTLRAPRGRRSRLAVGGVQPDPRRPRPAVGAIGL